MYTINENQTTSLEIKKSKFIAKIYKINTKEQIEEILGNLKKEYKDATHICYAYKLETNMKAADDGEPGGTAGLPILEILNKNELDHVLAVVIRYFGGIKLGSGGLIRAYSSSIREVLKQTKKRELVDGYKIEINCTYEEAKRIEYILKEYQEIQKEYLDTVKFTLHIELKDLTKIEEFQPKIIQKIKIEKDDSK